MFASQQFDFGVGRVPKTASVVFVSDMFADDGYAGGAELTSQALIDAAPVEVFKLRSRDVGKVSIETGGDVPWIFGNFAGLPPNLFYGILNHFAGGLSYAVLEYDYKFCRYRSPDKHKAETGQECDCHESDHGKLVARFYANSQAMFWMSETQLDAYLKRFPELRSANNIVLSSVFDAATLAKLAKLRCTPKDDRWAIVGSPSWVKGAEAGLAWCAEHGKTPRVIDRMTYDVALAAMASSHGFAYLPAGADTCPRTVIEAKLLGCELVTNENVQHRDEDWFNAPIADIEDYLAAGPTRFWSTVYQTMLAPATLSGYVTTRNAVSQGYPLVECVRSLLEFCDEVCVADGGSDDDTIVELMKLRLKLAKTGSSKKLVVESFDMDWNASNFGVNDGKLKAAARKMCTGTFCWQQDCDEIVPKSDAPKIRDMIERLPRRSEYVVALPVVEFWGGSDKVRLDVTPWKWRVSPNLPTITHGIPADLRATKDGAAVAAEGTDGCDVIHSVTGARIPMTTFYSAEAHGARVAALNGHLGALQEYSRWIASVVAEVPAVYHYSWFDIGRKIRLYRDYWTKHWNSLYGKPLEDTAESNMFFDKPWSEVTDADIETRAAELATGTGGWIFHAKWDGTRVPSLEPFGQNPIGDYK